MGCSSGTPTDAGLGDRGLAHAASPPGPSASARPQRSTGRVPDDFDHRRVAGEPPRRLRGDAAAASVLDESAPAVELALRDVEADLSGRTAPSGPRALRQEALDEDHQGVGAAARLDARKIPGSVSAETSKALGISAETSKVHRGGRPEGEEAQMHGPKVTRAPELCSMYSGAGRQVGL